jgi:hypothetical protein
MPTITLKSPWLLASLRAHLTTRTDVVTAASTDDALEVTILGSYSSANLRAELARRVRQWEHIDEADARINGEPIKVGRAGSSDAKTRRQLAEVVSLCDRTGSRRPIQRLSV